jgi:hypothetical protein
VAELVNTLSQAGDPAISRAPSVCWGLRYHRTVEQAKLLGPGPNMAMLEEFKRFAIKGSKIEEILLLREIRAALKK